MSRTHKGIVAGLKDTPAGRYKIYAEDDRDIRRADAIIARVRSGKTALVPADVAHAIAVDGVHPVRAWRVYKGWTGGELAAKAKLTRTTISQIETGKRKGTVAAYKAIAKALGTSVTSLID
ncbi:MAG: helix-turn-helix transcriptional regulator [Alphaproteobacteria bacterium]|nr:helix-turn-helix transcriptional regulator [Alphaproteobacteria bacterium]